VCVEDAPRNRQAEPGPTRLRVAGRVAAVERIEHTGQVLGCKARAGVRHGDDDFICFPPPTDPNLPSGRRMCHSVGEEVVQGALEQVDVNGNLARFLRPVCQDLDTFGRSAGQIARGAAPRGNRAARTAGFVGHGPRRR
jgi:hypothetical protein